MSDVYHSIMGLPGSGKTTFLAALWHLINAGEVPTGLVLDRLVGEHHYLNKIVDAWQQCKEVPRTSIASETRVSIHVHETSSGRKSVLGFPDLSGESFEQQLALRTCESSYVEDCNRDSGILLFVTADRPLDGIAIVDVTPAIDAPGEASPAETREWTPDMVPQQVKVVELLQFVQRPPFRHRRKRLSLAVSAWDVVRSSLSPTGWLEREMPLLYQFLRTNTASFEFNTYGISAQGGDFRGDQRNDLLKLTPSERIVCVGPQGQSHDLSEPILWLSSGD